MYTDPKARKDIRIRVNINHYEADVLEALARMHKKQTATYVGEIIAAHLESFENSQNAKDSVSNCA